MIRKSSVVIPKALALKAFDFIEEGSIFYEYKNCILLIACKNTESLNNFNLNMDFKLALNPVMQGDFPTLEFNFNFFNNKIYKEEVSNLVSIANNKEVEHLINYFNKDFLNLIIFSKDKDFLKSYELMNTQRNELIEVMKNFQIDIEHIIKNNTT